MQKPLVSSTNRQEVFVCKKYVKLRESSSKLFVLQHGVLLAEDRGIERCPRGCKAV
jgi:hypothetical protein